MRTFNCIVSMCAALFVFLLISPASATCTSPGGCGFTVECEVLDPISGLPKKNLKPGKDVKLRFDLAASDQVAEQKGHLTLFIKAKIKNFDFFVEVDQGTFIIDDCDARLAQDFVANSPDAIEHACTGKTELYEQIVTIPEDTPPGEVEVFAEVTIDNFGTAECSREVKITP